MDGEDAQRARRHATSPTRGVNEAVHPQSDERDVKVFSNGMVDMKNFVRFRPRTSTASARRSAFSVLREMLETVPDDGWKEAIEERRDELMPKHITKDDILASINYLLLHGPAAPARPTTSTISATAACAAWASCCRTSSAWASPVLSALSASA